MNKLICFGEVLVDEITLKSKPSIRFAGGAPANVAVGYSKLNGDSYFVGGIGSDEKSRFLLNELNHYKVNIEHLKYFKNATTATAIVSLDEHNDRSFEIHRNNTADTLFSKNDFSERLFDNAFAFHFCSNTLTQTSLFDATQFAVTQATNHNSIISFDVNLRYDLWSSNIEIEGHVSKFIKQSHITKMSHCELEFLSSKAKLSIDEYLESFLTSNDKLIIITNGKKLVKCYSNHQLITFQPQEVSVIDTTAAGDSFMAGFLYCLSLHLKNAEDFSLFCSSPVKIKKVLEYSSICGGLTCQKKGAFRALPDISQIKFLL